MPGQVEVSSGTLSWLFLDCIYKFQNSIFRYINFPSSISSVDTPGIQPNPQTEQRTCQQQPNCMRRRTIRTWWPASLKRCEVFSSVPWKSPCTTEIGRAHV